MDPVFANRFYFSQDKFFSAASEGRIVIGKVVSVTPTQVVLADETVLEYDYLVVASGAAYDGIYHSPNPGPFKQNIATKEAGVEALAQINEKVKAATKIFFIGGGPISIETACEVKGYEGL